MKNSEVQQTLHPDLPKEYTSKAVLAFVSLEDNTTLIICSGSHKRPELEHHTRITGRYGLAAGSALFFHPLLVHAGDFYIESNIRIHYYAFLEGTEWQVDSRYDLENSVAQQLTHDREVVSRAMKRKVRVQEAFERNRSIKRQKGEQVEVNFLVGKSIKIAAARVADDYGDECIESEVALFTSS